MYEWNPTGQVYENDIVGMPGEQNPNQQIGTFIKAGRERKPTDKRVFRDRPPLKLAIPKYRIEIVKE